MLGVFSRPAGRHSLRDAGDGTFNRGVNVGLIGRAGQTPPHSGDHRRGVVVIDHATVRGGVWAAVG